MGKPLRIAFMGTPDFVCPTVQSLIDGPHDLVCLYTQPPREKGRNKKLQKTPVHILGDITGIEVRHPHNFKSIEDIESFENLNLDVAIVAAYGMLLPQVILDAPKFGCINIHPSLLPRWRGPTPIQSTIWQGDEEAGVSVMSLEKSMDTGPIIAQESVRITSQTNFENLNVTLWKVGTKLLYNALGDLSETQKLSNTPQSDEGVSYCKLLTKEDGHVDWSQTAQQIDCQIRGLNPWPGTYNFIDGKRIKILQAVVAEETSDKDTGVALEDGKITCGDNTVLQLIEIQPENKKPMDLKTALNGGHLKEGNVFS